MHRRELIKEDIDRLSPQFQVMFALFCAKQVIHLATDPYREVCLMAINTIERWLKGEVSIEVCGTICEITYEVYMDAHRDQVPFAVTNALHSIHSATQSVIYAAFSHVDISYAASHASYSAVAAIRGASNTYRLDNDRAIDEQWDYYNDLLNFDKIAEEALLGD